jgi:ATP-binding cassette subfamily B protein
MQEWRVFAPTDMSQPDTAQGRGPFIGVFAFALDQWRRQAGLVALICTLFLVQTLADVLIPLYAGRLVDAISLGHQDQTGAARREALLAAGSMVGLALLTVAARHIAFLGVVRFTLRIMTQVARETFWRVQRFSTDWHANSFAGSTVRKITRGIWAFDMFNDTVLIALLGSFTVLVGATLLLGWHWPVMGLLIGACATAYVALTSGLSLTYVAPAARLSNFWDTKLGGALADAISCSPVVKGFGGEDREDERIARLLDKWRARTSRAWTRGTCNGSLQGLALVMLRAAVVGAVLWLWWRGEATPGDVVYVLTTYTVVQGYLRDVGMHIRNLQRAVNDMEEMVEFHGHPLGVADREGAKPLVIRDGRIVFECVTFHYAGHRTPLYEHFSTAIEAGERVGLVGHSGSGKTTFVKLLQRLYDVNDGRITIDGFDVARVTQASLRAQIAIVQQEPLLFHRSLAENIAYARPGATRRDVERAARLAHADEFIVRLARGYDTIVGERGVKLSGGERQRIAIARAFLADSPILVLDEATSSLDSESETLIQEGMQRLMVGRTAIVIAHRLSTVQNLDRILVFDRGRIVEEGDHVSLVRSENGIYRRLFERQALALAEGLTAAARHGLEPA